MNKKTLQIVFRQWTEIWPKTNNVRRLPLRLYVEISMERDQLTSCVVFCVVSVPLATLAITHFSTPCQCKTNG